MGALKAGQKTKEIISHPKGKIIEIKINRQVKK